MLVVTTDEVPGYTVSKVIGEVLGVTGRTRNPFKEGVRKLDGGGNDNMIQRLTEWRREAVDEMITRAEARGANAIVGMRFDHRNVSDMWGEICAYGTAVVLEPVARPTRPPRDAPSPGSTVVAGEGQPTPYLTGAG